MANLQETPDVDLCDRCHNHVAIYREKKRRFGRLTRDQFCATCLRWAYTHYKLAAKDFDQIRHGER